jgi:hypothetical protein
MVKITLKLQRWSRMSTIPWKLLVLRASTDFLDAFLNCPNRIQGYYSYVYEQVDLYFPRNSGLYMKLYKANSLNELRSRVWTKAAEISVSDLIDENKKTLRVLFAKAAPAKVIISCWPKNYVYLVRRASTNSGQRNALRLG